MGEGELGVVGGVLGGVDLVVGLGGDKEVRRREGEVMEGEGKEAEAGVSV